MSKRNVKLWIIVLFFGAIALAACTRTLATQPIALAGQPATEFDQDNQPADRIESSIQKTPEPTSDIRDEAPGTTADNETQSSPLSDQGTINNAPAEQAATPVVQMTGSAEMHAKIGASKPVDQQRDIPAKYWLRPGEFPYCIARRYNIDPQQIMELNHLSYEQLFFPGDILKLPQSAQPFPGERALHPHPDRYIVQPGDTIFSVACYYGDVDPKVLARANNLKQPYTLRSGQVLKVPAKGFEEDNSIASTEESKSEVVSQPVPAEPPASPSAQPATESPPVAPTESTQEVVTPSPVTPEADTATPTAPAQPDIMTTPPPSLPASRRGSYIEQAAEMAFNPADVIDADPADAVRNGKELYDLFSTQRIGDPCASATAQMIVYVPQQLELNQDIYFKMCQWPEDDATRLALAFPDGRLFSLEQIDRTTYLFASLPNDPPGEYQVVLYNPKTKIIAGKVPLQIRPLTGPRVSRYSTTDFVTSGSLFLYGFAPGEQVNIEVYKIVGANANEVVPIGIVVTNVDDKGQLQVVINEFALNALQYKYRVVGLQSGEGMYIVPEFIQ